MPRQLLLVSLSGLVAIGANASYAAEPPAPAFSDTIQQRVTACTACHGKNGEGIQANEYYPRIGAKPATYLYRQLINFRDGRRTGYPQMTYMVRYLSDEYLREMAEYFSKLKPTFPTPLKPTISGEALARGADLVTKGDPEKKIPACMACHGKALTGMDPGIPGLVGHYPQYLGAQIGAWQNKTRQADAPDCMATIASRLGGADISAIAGWLATRPGSAATLPPPENPQKLPIACGSQLQ